MQLTGTRNWSTALVVTGLLISSCTAKQSVQVRGDTRTYDDRTASVVSPHVSGRVALTDDMTLSPYWKADVISAATPVMTAPDAVSRATEYVETRHETGVGATWQADARSVLDASYTLSYEPDYVSHTIAASAARELPGRRATAGVEMQLGFDQISRSDVPDFDEKLSTVGLDLKWSHVLNPSLVVHTAYTFEWRQGYQANPYRRVPVFEFGDLIPRLVLAERVPNTRLRHAIEGMGIWAINSHLFVRGSYRFSLDHWGIGGHTARLEGWQTLLEDALRLRLRIRAYTQNGADFYHRRYVTVPQFRTGDYRLSTMTTWSGGLRSDLRLVGVTGTALTLSASYDAMHFDLPQYVVFSSMLAHLVGLSLTMEWK